MTDIFEYGDKTARVILIQPVHKCDSDSIEEEMALIRKNSAENFRLIAFGVSDWNRDLSPWAAPAVFGKDDFGGRAADTLETIMKFCEDRTKTYYIGGYSLAGLFALWTAYQTDMFQGIAAASPSIWFPGFVDFMRERKAGSRHIYLSLGDREEKTRNPVMAAAGEKIRTAHTLLKGQDVNCFLEWNEGNHFRDAGLRTAKAFSWVMKQDGLQVSGVPDTEESSTTAER